ncbi:MAG: CBS domain-containing protein [Archangium sp.]|nr:CBS domain-containing protein [Archangium sp.]
MSKSIPPIQKFMTTSPKVVSPDATVKQAHDVMRELNIRHLPVCEGDRCIGVISDGDLFRLEALFSGDVSTTKASAVMTRQVYTVSPAAPVDEVVEEMARKKFGSAVVVDNGKVVGVFTATDALGAFAELLQTRLRH